MESAQLSQFRVMDLACLLSDPNTPCAWITHPFLWLSKFSLYGYTMNLEGSFIPGPFTEIVLAGSLWAPQRDSCPDIYYHACISPWGVGLKSNRKVAGYFLWHPCHCRFHSVSRHRNCYHSSQIHSWVRVLVNSPLAASFWSCESQSVRRKLLGRYQLDFSTSRDQCARCHQQ